MTAQAGHTLYVISTDVQVLFYADLRSLNRYLPSIKAEQDPAFAEAPLAAASSAAPPVKAENSTPEVFPSPVYPTKMEPGTEPLEAPASFPSESRRRRKRARSEERMAPAPRGSARSHV